MFINQLDTTTLHIETIGKQIDGLNKLRLLSNIELARLGLLDHSFNREIEGITNRVTVAIETNKKQFESIKQSLSANLTKLDNTMIASQRQVLAATGVIEQSQQEIKVINDIVNQAIQALNMEVTALSSDVSELRVEFSKIGAFKEDISEMLANIEIIQEEAEQTQRYYLEYFGEKGWESKTKNIRILFNNLLLTPRR